MGPIAPALAAAARLVLAGALLWSAVAKVRSWRALPGDLLAFGIPSGATTGVAIVLPLAEFAVAIMLVAWWASPVPGWVALVLLVAFTALLIRAAARGAPCPCFGSGHERPSGAAGVARNGVLIALAVLSTGDPRGAEVAGVIVFVVLLGALTVAAVRFSSNAGHGGHASRARPRPG